MPQLRSRVRLAGMRSPHRRPTGQPCPIFGWVPAAWEEGEGGPAGMGLTRTMGRLDAMRRGPRSPRVVRVRSTCFSLLLLDIASRCWKKA